MKKQIILFLALIMSMIATAQVTIQMEKDGGVYKVPCTVNGVKMKFVFDTGASTVCISQSMAKLLLDGGYLSVDDIVGMGQSFVADGSLVNHIEIVLRDVEIGGMHIHNVEATVIEGQNAPLLLGLSAISELGRVSIDGNQLIIHSADSADFADNELSDEQIEKLEKQIQKYLELDSYAAAIECFETINTRVGLTELGMYKLCYCYFQDQQYEKCIQTGKKWIELYEENGDKEYKFWVFYNIAGSYINSKDDYHKALLYYQKALYVLSNDFDSREYTKEEFCKYGAIVYYSIGDCYYWIKDYSKSYDNGAMAATCREHVLHVTTDDVKTGKVIDDELGRYYFLCSACCFELNKKGAEKYWLNLSAKCGNNNAKQLEGLQY